MNTVHVNLADRSYDIRITSDDRSGLVNFIRERARSSQAFVVSDANLESHHEPLLHSLKSLGVRTSAAVLAPGESQKSLGTAALLYNHLADMRADRKTLVVAVGGGVIGDVAGFVAATFNRGIPLLMVPTTLLAMVDSSVGGKVGVNHPRGKNLIGAFHQPIAVWIDTSFLDTLPDREYRSGLAEVVKYGVILDADFFEYLERNVERVLARDAETVRQIVARCCRLKADVVEKDEREETGLRAVLNYGHTFAHAFETVGGYGNWLHGEAVAAGMVCASRLAEQHGLVPGDVTRRQIELLRAFGLPTAPRDWPVENLLSVMRSDKKNIGGKLRLVLPTRLGEVRLFDDVAESDIPASLRVP